MPGWIGRKLTVNLTDSKAEKVPLSQAHLESYLGGWGLNTAEFSRAGSNQGLPPPDGAVLSLATGPLTGTLAPSPPITAFGVCLPVRRKPPEGSCMHLNFGGDFGPILKYSGYDQLVIAGKAAGPRAIFIRDDEIDFLDVSGLDRRDPGEIRAALRRDSAGKFSTLLYTGLIAREEHRSELALLDDRGRLIGGPKLASVFADMNLVGVSLTGSGAIEVYDTEGFRKIIGNDARVFPGRPCPCLSPAESTLNSRRTGQRPTAGQNPIGAPESGIWFSLFPPGPREFSPAALSHEEDLPGLEGNGKGKQGLLADSYIFGLFGLCPTLLPRKSRREEIDLLLDLFYGATGRKLTREGFKTRLGEILDEVMNDENRPD